MRRYILLPSWLFHKRLEGECGKIVYIVFNMLKNAVCHLT